MLQDCTYVIRNGFFMQKIACISVILSDKSKHSLTSDNQESEVPRFKNMKYQGRIQDFFQGGGGGGALVSCSTSTPINHTVFFCIIPVALENRRSSQGGGGCAPQCTLPLDPPLNINTHLKRTSKFKLHNEYNKRTLFSILYSCFKMAIDNKIANLIR